jgi:hypothetical protein
LAGEAGDAFAVIAVFGFWGRRLDVERGSDLRQFCRPNGVGEKAEMSDAAESLWQHVLKKSADAAVDSNEGARQLRDNGAHRFLDDAAPRRRDDGARVLGLAG